jgi:hypothetical protein
VTWPWLLYVQVVVVPSGSVRLARLPARVPIE